MKKRIAIALLLLLLVGCSRKTLPEGGLAPPPQVQQEESSAQPDEASPYEEENGSSAPPVELPKPTVPPEPLPPARDEASIEEIPTEQAEEGVLEATPLSPAESTAAPPMVKPREEVLPSPYLAQVEGDIVRLINSLRVELGLGEFVHDARLTEAARIRSREMYRNKYFAHGRPNGDSWETVLHKDVPVTYTAAGENLARVEHNMTDYNPAYDARYWFETWLHSPEHYENMVREGFTHIGTGVFYEHQGGFVHSYATTIFAKYESK